ncbi:hypothetical protein [Aquipuribacter sp. SD81]|uniref:hypothetical protein n=1 Tax=Aquipuribacter sp. SD81 TaxID=3127703 RepID=UPI00301B11E2
MGDDVSPPAGPGGREDADLLVGLRDMWERLDPPPPGLAGRVRFALEVEHLTRDLDVELMRLQQESLVGAGGRGDDVRTVTFGSRTLTVMLAISDVDGGFRVDGWVAPGGRRSVEVRTSEGSTQQQCDETGRFTLERVPPGHLQLVLASTGSDGADGGRVATGVVTPALTL